MSASDTRTERVDLPITGMTSASCAAKIEKKLNGLEGVSATVNYATDKATVHYTPGAVEPEALVGAVESLGYGATLPASAGHEGNDEHAMPGNGMQGPGMHDHTEPVDQARQRLLVTAALAIPVIAMSMISALQFDESMWLAFALASPVVGWRRLALPPRGLGEPPPWGDHHGHAHQHGGAGRLRVVRVRAVLGRGRADRRDDDHGRSSTAPGSTRCTSRSPRA